MKTYIGSILLITTLLASCGTHEDVYVNWTKESDSTTQRLNDANIHYEIRDGEIWIREKDMTDAVICCT